MADKEMIAATLAAGVLAAAPPVIDPLAAAKEAASLYLRFSINSNAKRTFARPRRRVGATRVLPATRVLQNCAPQCAGKCPTDCERVAAGGGANAGGLGAAPAGPLTPLRGALARGLARRHGTRLVVLIVALPVFLVQRLSRQGESARNGLAATNANLRTSSPTAPLI